MAPKIRAFASGDLPTLHTIRTAAFAPIFQSFRDALGPQLSALAFATAETEQGDLLDAICKPGSQHHVFVVEIDGSIAGFLTYLLNPDKRGEITLNAVHPDHDGKGLGTMLYVFALEQMKVAGMTYATVGTGGDTSHAPARRAYEKAGFTLGIPSVYLYSQL
jgi:ribosomal protein S18 acetylase RimI-like enzyme